MRRQGGERLTARAWRSTREEVPRPSNTDVRRAEIAQGLLAVMSEVGYERATITAIAEAAGLASGLVHYHFENKQAILVAAVERLTAGLDARVDRRLARARGDRPEGRLHAVLDALVARGKDADPRAVAAWVVVAAEAVRLPEVRDLYRSALRGILSRLEVEVAFALVARGRRAGGARRIAAALLAAVEGSYQIAAAAPGLMPAGFAAGVLRRMADGLIASELPV